MAKDKPLTDADIAAQDPTIANPPQVHADSTPIESAVPSVPVTVYDPITGARRD